MATTIQPYLDKLAKLDFSKMYNEDFLLTWEKSGPRIQKLKNLESSFILPTLSVAEHGRKVNPIF